MIRRSSFYSLLFICIATMSCNDLIDKNLTKAQLQIVSPPDNFVASNYSIVFLWEQLDGASDYRIQIVQPSFSNLQQLLIDTPVVGTNFTYQLSPGSYQWRINAENGSSSTQSITRNIKVDSNSNLSGQTFLVNSPSDNYYTQDTVVTFSWNNFPYATRYNYILTDTNSNILHIKYTSQNIISDTLQQGVYLWKVQAIDTINNTSTLYSAPRRISIDLAAPGPSTPSTPANNSIDTNAVTLTWIRPAGVYADSLFVGTDSTFQSPIVATYLINNTSYILAPQPINQTYFWRLRSRDEAGNWSTYSYSFQFYIQQ